MEILTLLTQGFLVKERRFRRMLLSRSLGFPYQPGKNFLVVYSMGSALARITAYPVDATEIWKFSIIFKTFESPLAEKVAGILGSRNLIHTTGLCEKHNKTVLENYLLPDGNWGKAESLRYELQAVPEIQAVGLEQILLR